MIRIDRHRTDDQGVPIRPTAGWTAAAEILTEAAILSAGAAAISDHYRRDSIKVALEALFHDKCAYCGIKITGAAAWDVEHFRPKGRVAERKDHSGYYWLAYAWENLYPACQECNQARKDPPRWGDMTQAGPAMGKLDQFPLVNEQDRAQSPQDPIAAEAPLMLDPCSDEPSGHIAYTRVGDVVAVNGSQRGEATIQICHWKRKRLRDRRRGHIERIRDILGFVATDGVRQQILERYCEDREEFAAVARSMRADPAAFDI